MVAPHFKVKTALAVIREVAAQAQFASRFGGHLNSVLKWKREEMDTLTAGFPKESDRRDGSRKAEIKTLRAEVDELVAMPIFRCVTTKIGTGRY